MSSSTFGESIESVGVGSLSGTDNVGAVTAPMPSVLVMFAVSLPVRSGSSLELLTALMVAVSVALVVLPAGMVMVASEPTV